MYNVVKAAVTLFLPGVEEQELLEIMSEHFFQRVSDESFMTADFQELAVDEVDVEEFERAAKSSKEANKYRKTLMLPSHRMWPRLPQLQLLAANLQQPA